MAWVMDSSCGWDENEGSVAAVLRLDDDVIVLDMDLKGLGDVRALLESVLELSGEFLAAFDRDRKGTDPDPLRIEPGLPVAHVEFPAVPGAAQHFAGARALVDAGLL